MRVADLGKRCLMRRLMSVLCGVIAVLAFAVAVPVWWTAENVSDSDGFVELMGPLAGDGEIHEALATRTASELGTRLHLPHNAQETVHTKAAQAIGTVAETSLFNHVWNSTLADSHDATLDEAADGDVIVDLKPVTSLVVDRISPYVGQNLRVPDQSQVTISAGSQSDAFAALRQAPTIRWLAVGLGVVAAAAAIGLARSRASTVCALSVAGLCVVAAFWLAVTKGVPPMLERAAADDEFAYHMLHATGSRITSSLQHTLTYTGIATAVVAAASGLWRLIRSPAHTRRKAGSAPRSV